MEKKIKHLEMIEALIERMAKNCFQIKGWTITLVSLVGTFSTRDADKRFILLAFIPILVFWYLDAYYLHLERRYRGLYREVAEKGEDKINFNLDTSVVPFSPKEKKRSRYYRCFFSPSVLPFYSIIAGILVVLCIVLKVFTSCAR